MSVIIKSGASADTLTVDTTSKAMRVTPYDSANSELGTITKPLEVVQVESGYNEVAASFYVSTFRILGVTGALHNIFTIHNSVVSRTSLTDSSDVLLGIKAITILADNTAAQAAVSTNFRAARFINFPTGGTALTPAYDNLLGTAGSGATYTSRAICTGANASDGGAATAITITQAPVNSIWSSFSQRFASATLTAPVYHYSRSLLPIACQHDPLIVRPGEGIVVRAISASIAAVFYIVNCWWQEIYR